MLPDLIVSAIPFFFVAIAVEAVIDRARKGSAYRLGALVADLDTGVTSQVGDAFLKGFGVALYAVVYERYRFVTLPAAGPLPWMIGIVGIDFLYYWWHRASHVINALWAVHAVHHQSEDFNLAVALRQPFFESLTVIPFHLPLALVGVPPVVYVSSYAIDLLAQFWIHTELIGRVPPLEGWLNTPSAHRVHHGIDPEYLDRNFGGIFVLWDRLFGTYLPERQRPTYGVTHRLGSFDPVWANFAELERIGHLSRIAKSGREKLYAWFAHPSWKPTAAASADDQPSAPAKGDRRASLQRRGYDPPIAPSTWRYVLAHFLIVLAAGGVFANAVGKVDEITLAIGGTLLVVSMVTLAAWTQSRSWAPLLDATRLAAALAALAWILAPRWGTTTTIAIVATAALVLAGLFAATRPITRFSPPA